MSTKNALADNKNLKKLKKLSQIDVLSSPKCSPIYYAFHFKEVLILSKINSFACESGVKKKFVVRCKVYFQTGILKNGLIPGAGEVLQNQVASVNSFTFLKKYFKPFPPR